MTSPTAASATTNTTAAAASRGQRSRSARAAPPPGAGADSTVVFLSDAGIDVADVQKALKARLPAYMAPREVRHVDRFPLNSNGKVDRKALVALLEAKG